MFEDNSGQDVITFGSMVQKDNNSSALLMHKKINACVFLAPVAIVLALGGSGPELCEAP